MAAYDLKTALTKVGVKPMSFSYFKGEDDNQIFVGSAAPTPVLLKEIEKECGKLKCVLKGVCFREGDLLVFATKTPPAPQWKMQLANVMKTRKAPGASNIDLRQLGGDETETAGEGTEGADKVGDPATNPTGDTGADAKSAVPQPKAPLSAEWSAAREAAVQGVADLVGKLQATGDGDAVKAGGIVQKLAAGFPAGLDTALTGLEKAMKAADPKALAVAKAQAKSQTDACLAFLSANQKLIGLCEGNPFGATVAISLPLKAALLSISARIK